MPTQVNSNCSENFQKFVDFANKAYALDGSGEELFTQPYMLV